MRIKLRHLIIFILLLIAVSFEFFLIKENNLRTFSIILTVILFTLPIVVMIVIGQRRQSQKDSKFLEFARDLVENAKSGTPIVQGIFNLQNKDYASLTPHIQKLASQLSLGIPLNSALQTFARESQSKVIARAVTLISEAQKAGGKIETILESVANSVNQIENLKKERKSAVANLITQGYIIFIVFIVIMLILQFKILPVLSDLSGAEGIGVKTGAVNAEDFSRPLFILLIVQSLFAGLVIGKVSEGEIKRGIKHSFILLALTLLVTTGIKALVG